MKTRKKLFAVLTAAVSMLGLFTAMPAHAAELEPETATAVLTASDIAALKQIGATDELIAQAMTAAAPNVQHYVDYHYNTVPISKATKYLVIFYEQSHPGVKKYDLIPGFTKISSFELDTSDKTSISATVVLEEEGCYCIARHVYNGRDYVAPTKASNNRNVYNILVGDVNLDGVVDSNDATLLSRYLLSDPTVVLTDIGKLAADVNLDGTLDGDDAMMIMRFIAGSLNSFWDM